MGGFAPTGALNMPRAFAVGEGSLGDNGFAYVAGGGSADAEAYRFATIKTDKLDYYPWEPAVITGSGDNQAKRSLIFQEDPAVHDDYRLSVTADSNGDIHWDQWAPDWHDLGVRFYLTAQDLRSHVQMTFTDAPRIGAVSLGLQSLTPMPNTAGDHGDLQRHDAEAEQRNGERIVQPGVHRPSAGGPPGRSPLRRPTAHSQPTAEPPSRRAP